MKACESVYEPKIIESKWQKFWQEHKVFEPKSSRELPKKYILSMFPYPSGAIHMGHVRNYCIGDALARHYRHNGFNVLHPMGWDAFGMPAENAAIKHKTHPKQWTYANIDTMRAELASLGLSFSRDREFATCDPIYTRWEQEFFIKMWEKGLIYRKEAYLNWCPNDQTVLANEQVIEGKCWRCDTPVVQKQMFQYYIKITQYAQELLDDLQTLQGHWASQVLTMQQNWIGKSKGLNFAFTLSEDSKQKTGIESFEVFTTRCDTLFGVTYCAIAPEHPLVDALLQRGLLDAAQVRKIEEVRKFPAKERSMMDKEGFDLGLRAIHPLSGEEIPIWVANFVLIEYANGAVMAVPAHDERDYEFAQKYALPIKPVLKPGLDSLPFCDDGELIESGAFSGLKGAQAREQIIAYFEERKLGKGVINYRLRDWGVSRQRYWGAPIPMVHCPQCGIVPEKIENLPVLLPDDVVIDGEGNPLDKHPTWKQCSCPKCGASAQRESDTMDTFVQSSWYFLRYATSREHWEECAFRSEDIAYWLSVDEYIGGIEHAVIAVPFLRRPNFEELSSADEDDVFLYAGNLEQLGGDTHPALRVLAVKARDDGALLAPERFGEQRVGALVVQPSVGAEFDDVARVDEGNVQERRHHPAREILPARGAEIRGRLPDDRLPRLGEDGVDIERKPQFGDDAAETFADLLVRRSRLAVEDDAVARLIEKVGHFDIAAEPLARRGDDDVAAGGVAFDDALDAEHRDAVRHGRAAEFTNFNHS